MNILKNASWIKASSDFGTVSPIFKRDFCGKKQVAKASLTITALGVYEAYINCKRVGDFFMAPGWTSYSKRLQVQIYDVTDMIKAGEKNELSIVLGKGWCMSELAWCDRKNVCSDVMAVIGALDITYTDGTNEYIVTDDRFECAQTGLLYSEIYHGEICDSRTVPTNWTKAAIHNYSKEAFIPQQGEIVREIECFHAVELIKTPIGETVIDFGQNITGYVEFKVNAKSGDKVNISHAEILDQFGNFYTTNLRSAKQMIDYTCKDGEQSYKPHFSFQGFRYIRLNEFPGNVNLADFKAVVVHSDMERTGHFECSNEKINKLFKNVIYGQKGNYLDVPTDCPQRNERLGWTGDAQVFVRAASYNFNVERFFAKWLGDLKADQHENGCVPAVIPDVLYDGSAGSTAWGDASVICPWQMYLTYGNKEIITEQFDSMRGWVEYMRKQGDNECLWDSPHHHFGDWVNLDGEGKDTARDLIASAYYAYSTSLLIKSGEALGRDMSEYKALYTRIVDAYKERYIVDGKLTSNTQTAHALTLYFELCDNTKQIADSLAKLVKANGECLTTGFVGTPYLLHALSSNGHEDLAYTLLLQEKYPSWLFSVNRGATTIWERWNGIHEDGTLDDPGMNSFNHYAYGAVADFMYGVVCGINTDEQVPGFKHIIFKPIVDGRLEHASASINTKSGSVESSWILKDGMVRYSFTVPVGSVGTVIIGDMTCEIGEGTHSFCIAK